MLLARMQVERGSPYPSRACSPLAVYRVARLPGPGDAVVLSQCHAHSFPLAAVPLSHLAPAISMARNSRSTSRFQLCRSPNENAEVPAAFRNGHFECELSVEISLAACLATLMAGSTSMWGNRGAVLSISSHDGRPASGDTRRSNGIVMPSAARSTRRLGALRHLPNLT